MITCGLINKYFTQLKKPSLSKSFPRKHWLWAYVEMHIFTADYDTEQMFNFIIHIYLPIINT